MSIMEDWRKSAKGQARIKRARQFLLERARQFLLECTEEGDGFSVSYITLKHHYYSWCQSIGLPREECGFGEIYHVLNERALLRYEPSTKGFGGKTTVIGVRMKHPVGFPRYYNKGDRKSITNKVKEAVYAKLRSNGNMCALCGRPILTDDKVHIDHIIPVRQGGMDDPSNLQVVHDICNLTKG